MKGIANLKETADQEVPDREPRVKERGETAEGPARRNGELRGWGWGGRASAPEEVRLAIPFPVPPLAPFPDLASQPHLIW